MTPQRSVTTCLIDGEYHFYDACSKDRNAYDEAVFRYIGYGVVDMVNGVKETQPLWRYFFVKTKDKDK